jgi:hypothetical protein
MFTNTYQSTVKWVKANFHTHAGTGPNTCGAYEIDDVLALYREAGYGILTISNHDRFTDVKEYQPKHDITLINGFEYSKDKHMLCIGNTGLVSGTHQDVIDECVSQGGFVILCHPNWQEKEYWPWKDMEALNGYTGIEIYNGTVFRLKGSGLATDAWDYLLSRGKKVWGFGNDDFHRWHDFARVWNVICTPSMKEEDIKESIRKGNFYVSTGLVLQEFSRSNGLIKISARAGDTYVTENLYRFIGVNGRVLDEQTGEYGEYRYSGDEPYIRVQVVSEHGAMLWTQPIYFA